MNPEWGIRKDKHYGMVLAEPKVSFYGYTANDVAQEMEEVAKSEGYRPSERTHTGQPVVYLNAIHKYIEGDDPKDWKRVEDVYFIKVEPDPTVRVFEFHFDGPDPNVISNVSVVDLVQKMMWESQ